MTNEISVELEIQAFLNNLDKIPWFENMGKPIKDEDIRQVFSLEDAWESLQDDSWTYASFHYEIEQDHPVWATAYDRAYDAVVRSGNNFDLGDDNPIARAAGWDAGGAAYQIAKGMKEGFYLKLIDWYRKGHWPCGWEGNYPKGKLIVF